MTTVPKTRAGIQIQNVWPMLDCRRYPVKRTLGDPLDVWADVFADGHDVLRAVVRYKPPSGRRWSETPMESIGNDRWHGSVATTELGRWQDTLTPWIDPRASGQGGLERKLE